MPALVESEEEEEEEEDTDIKDPLPEKLQNSVVTIIYRNKLMWHSLMMRLGYHHHVICIT